MPVYISLLRGINVGGNKKIQMAELKALYESLGFGQVQTLLQSGNVVYTSADADPDEQSRRIEVAIEGRFGFQSRIILRSHDQLRAVFERHPFTAEQLAEPAKILVMFLENAPGDQAIQALRQAHAGPEVIYPGGQELYIYYTDGMGRSKLDNNFIERRLKTTGTGRNWNTVSKLLALAGTLHESG